MKNNMQDRLISENVFFDWHEQLKKAGGRIYRCWEVTMGRHRYYKVIYSGNVPDPNVLLNSEYLERDES